jgi:hypothetical protein
VAIENTLSAAAHQIAKELSLLSAVAQQDGEQCADIARFSVEHIRQLLTNWARAMRKEGHKFAVPGEVSNVVSISGRLYRTAHDAAFEEAALFMGALWFHLDPEGNSENARLGARRDDSDESVSAREALINGTGLDLIRVASDWQKAKAVIVQCLHLAWYKDFAIVEARILREEAQSADGIQQPNIHPGAGVKPAPQRDHRVRKPTYAQGGHWEIETGGFWFMAKGGQEKFYNLSGLPLALLQVFLEKRLKQTFSMSDLRGAWNESDDDLVLEQSVRTQLKNLRKVLRKVVADFSLAIDGNDPLPHKKGVGGSSWSFLLPRP